MGGISFEISSFENRHDLRLIAYMRTLLNVTNLLDGLLRKILNSNRSWRFTGHPWIGIPWKNTFLCSDSPDFLQSLRGNIFMLSEQEKQEWTAMVESQSLRDDMRHLTENRHNPFLKEGEVDIDKYVAYLQSTFDQILDALGLEFEEIIGLTRLERFM